MKDAVGILSVEAMRLIARIVLPWAIASSPWLTIAWFNCIGHAGIDDALAWVMGVLAVILAGLLCEEIGTELEARLDKRPRPTGFESRWQAYLLTQPDRHPIMTDLIKERVASLRFERATVPASISCCLGCVAHGVIDLLSM